MRTTTSNWCVVLSGGVDQGKSRDAHQHPIQISQVASTAQLGWRVFAQSFEVVAESE